MSYTSVFDIIGPIMVGPSSSHTAGALKIAKHARGQLHNIPTKATITLYNSFAKTYKGHATDVALIGGILDFETDDLRIPQAKTLANDANIAIAFILEEDVTRHPNTVHLELESEDLSVSVLGESIGGGAINILSTTVVPKKEVKSHV